MVPNGYMLHLMEKVFLQESDLPARWRAAQDCLEGIGNAIIITCQVFLIHDPLGQVAGSFDESDVVHQGKGLKRGNGLVLADDAYFALGSVEGEHGGGRNGAAPIGVKASAVKLVSLVLLIAVVGNRSPDAGRHVGANGRTSDLGYQQTGRDQGGVTDGIGRKAAPRPPGQEPILGIRIGMTHRGLTVGGGSNEHLVGCLQIPSPPNEFGG